MGTWCEDSQREVPGMMKILAAAGYSTKQMEIIAVDEDNAPLVVLNCLLKRRMYLPLLFMKTARNQSNC